MPPLSFYADIHLLKFRLIKHWGRKYPSLPFWRLWWNDRPGGSVKMGETVYHLTQETLLLIPPHTPCHRFLNTPLYHFYCHFNLGLPWDLVRNRIFELAAPPHIESIIADATTQRDTVAQFATGEILMGAFRQIPTHIFEHLVFDERIQIAISHMEANIHRHVPNSEFAQLLHLTANTFVRLFKSQTGISPQAFHKQMRLDRAAILLTQHTHMTIEEVAEATGFYDRHHLARAFRKRYAYSPATYRRLVRK
ncbi:MAG: helix-turn-helix domain-containing protein [Lentisphaerae bacterium]|nr:MAG: helix-turn-helix domain-containing protein [Lentisphaerota bacterium]